MWRYSADLLCSVTQRGRYSEKAFPADLHAIDADLEARDYSLLAERERKRLLTDGSIKYGSICELSDIINSNHCSRLGFCSGPHRYFLSLYLVRVSGRLIATLLSRRVRLL